MNKQNKVSVIIPIFNSEKTLNKCIESVIAQTYDNIEILLINDGSTDNSEKICKDYENTNENIVLITQKNSGPSAARNNGIKKATGNFIFFLDADDYIDNEVIFELVKKYEENTLLGVKHRVVEKTKTSIERYNTDYSRENFIENILTDRVLGVIWGYLLEKEKMKKMVFDENTNYLEDTMFLLEYLENNKINKISYIENKMYNYVITEEGITRTKKNIKMKCENYIYSLNKINEMTGFIYEKIINNKIVVFIEKEMRYLTTTKEYKEFICSELSIKYDGTSIRYKIFNFIYNTKNIFFIRLYYCIRNIAKNIKRIVKD